MKKISLSVFSILAMAICLTLGSESVAQTVRTNSLDALKSAYDAASTKIFVDMHKQKDMALEAYGESLEEIMQKLKQKGDIEGWSVVDAEMKRFQAEKTVTTNECPPDVSKAVASYEKQMKDADTDADQRQFALLKKYIAALSVLVKELMTNGKFDEAKAVGDIRKAAEARLGESVLPQPKTQESATKIDLSGMWIDGWNAAVKREVSRTGDRIFINSRNEKWEGVIETDGTIKLNCQNDKQTWDFVAKLSSDGKRLSGIVTWGDGRSKEWWWLREEAVQKYTPPGKKPVPAEAVEFKGHHYMVYSDSSNWDRAKFLCSSRYGHLVVISDAEENQFVYGLMRHLERVWVGASKELGDWRWCMISRFDYANWAPGEPNSGKALNMKVCMYGDWSWNESMRGRWDDRPGNSPEVKGYVCEWDY